MAVEPAVLSVPDPEDADSLVSSNDPDDMQNEQTWPTEEEMQDDSPQNLQRIRSYQRVPLAPLRVPFDAFRRGRVLTKLRGS
jgi:hypothetical protein